MSVRLSARNSSARTGRVFIKLYIWLFFENMSPKFRYHQNPTRITSTVRPTYICEHTCYIARFILGWESFQTRVVEKIKTYLLYYSITLFFKSCHLCDNVQKYCTAGQVTDDNTAHAYFTLGNLRLQTDTQNMQYLLHFRGNDCCTNVPHCYVTRTLTFL